VRVVANEVLKYAKFDAGKVEFDVHPVRVADGVREVSLLIELQRQAGRYSGTGHLSGHLREGDAGVEDLAQPGGSRGHLQLSRGAAVQVAACGRELKGSTARCIAGSRAGALGTPRLPDPKDARWPLRRRQVQSQRAGAKCLSFLVFALQS
jgi:hypothetical protein